LTELTHLGYTVVTDPSRHFDTVTLNVKASGLPSADFVVSEFHKFGINLRRVDDAHVSVAFNETTNLVDLDELIEIFAELKDKQPANGFLTEKFYENRKYNELPKSIARTSSFLQ